MNLDFERKEEINYSIIIPHKNSTVLLERCLRSIPCRKDVQVIVVDDNSENQEELNAVVGGFSQVELILTQGGGAGHARNEGLKYIREFSFPVHGMLGIYGSKVERNFQSGPIAAVYFINNLSTGRIRQRACLACSEEREVVHRRVVEIGRAHV